MKYRGARVVALAVALSLLMIVHAGADETASDKAADEVNKQLSNPISSIWALQLQQNTYWLNRPERNVVNLQFQPVLPLSLTDDWNLITRPVFQVMNSTPYVNKSGNLHRVTGFGDTILATILSPSPKVAGPWLFGAGPSFIFPTASNSRLGQNKWQIGPAGVFRLRRRQMARRSVSPAVVFLRGPRAADYQPDEYAQYFFVYLPGHGWGLGTSPNMLINWYASDSNKVTFPLGLNVSKVVWVGPLPVKFLVQGQYMPVHPEVAGQKWNLQFAITPVIPKLIKRNLFGD